LSTTDDYLIFLFCVPIWHTKQKIFFLLPKNY
jgi:hypothetical protein